MLEQRGQLAGIFLRRDDQFSLELVCSCSDPFDILARIGMVIGVDDFIKNLESYLLNEEMKRPGMAHTATELSLIHI